MRNIFKKLLFQPSDTTDVEVEKLRQKVGEKVKEVERAQQRFERTTTYYVGRAAGVIK